MRSGSNSRAWYREHAHPVLLPLDEEEMHLLRSLIGVSKQMLHFLMLLHHALDGQEGRDLASLANTIQGIKSITSDINPLGNKVPEQIQFWCSFCFETGSFIDHFLRLQF